VPQDCIDVTSADTNELGHGGNIACVYQSRQCCGTREISDTVWIVRAVMLIL
jgi:hypothetical protein